jgi:SEFIR domain
MADRESPNVFISYSHDSKAHIGRILALARQLRDWGVTAEIDQFVISPAEGWPRWMMGRIDEAKFILAVCTENYSRRVMGREEPTVGLGGEWEGALITQEIYESKANKRCIPVIFEASDSKFIPPFLRSATYFNLEGNRDLEKLYRYITDQPAIVASAVGSLLPMPPEEFRDGTTLHHLAPGENLSIGAQLAMEAFNLLDRARSFGAERQELLERLERCIADAHGSDADPVFLAVKEFLAFERDRSGEVYRLEHGVALLETALRSTAASSDTSKNIYIHVGLLQEKINLFLVEDQSTHARNQNLSFAIEQGEKILSTIPKDDSVTLIRCLVLLCEAIKELAMVEKDAQQHLQHVFASRKYGDRGLAELQPMNGSPEVQYLRGVCKRHIAVTYELEADALSDRSQGLSGYEKWKNLSWEASAILKDIGETTVRAYAMLNVGSSLTRLAGFEVNRNKQLQMYAESDQLLRDSIPLFRQADEHRGVGWAYVHLCERGVKALALSPDESKVKLEELESLANRAVGELRRGADHLALGLGYQYLGIILYSIVRQTGEDGIRLARAIRSLEEAIRHLTRTGFHRGVGEACLWKAQCHLALWKNSNDSRELTAAINELSNGASSTGFALENVDFLERLCVLLDQQLRRVLDA